MTDTFNQINLHGMEQLFTGNKIPANASDLFFLYRVVFLLRKQCCGSCRHFHRRWMNAWIVLGSFKPSRCQLFVSTHTQGNERKKNGWLSSLATHWSSKLVGWLETHFTFTCRTTTQFDYAWMKNPMKCYFKHAFLGFFLLLLHIFFCAARCVSVCMWQPIQLEWRKSQ